MIFKNGLYLILYFKYCVTYQNTANYLHIWASLVAQTIKNPPAMQETYVLSLGWEDPLEEGMATHSSILAWRILMDRGACRLQSTGSQRVRLDWATIAHTHLRIHILILLAFSKLIYLLMLLYLKNQVQGIRCLY